MLFVVSRFEPWRRVLERKGKVVVWDDIRCWSDRKWDKELTVCLPMVWRVFSTVGEICGIDELTENAIEEMCSAVQRGRKVVIIFPEEDHYKEWGEVVVGEVERGEECRNREVGGKHNEILCTWIMHRQEKLLNRLLFELDVLSPKAKASVETGCFSFPHKVEGEDVWENVFSGLLQSYHYLLIPKQGCRGVRRLAWFDRAKYTYAFAAPKAPKLLAGFSRLLNLDEKALLRLLKARQDTSGMGVTVTAEVAFTHGGGVRISGQDKSWTTKGTKLVVILLLLADRCLYRQRGGEMEYLSGKEIAVKMNLLRDPSCEDGWQNIFRTPEAKEFWERCSLMKRLQATRPVVERAVRRIICELRKEIAERVTPQMLLRTRRGSRSEGDFGYYLAESVKVTFPSSLPQV